MKSYESLNLPYFTVNTLKSEATTTLMWEYFVFDKTYAGNGLVINFTDKFICKMDKITEPSPNDK